MGKCFEQTLHRRKYREANKHLKNCSLSVFIREMNFKSQWHILELLKVKRFTIPNTGEDVDEMLLSYIADRSVN